MNGASLIIKSPISVGHDWQYIWFDYCHQHSLLLNGAYFYTQSYLDKDPTPNLFYHQEELPKNILLAKVSLDLKIIAVQMSLTSILVIDTTNKKKWYIEIKHPNDNVILHDGIIWSDHGGNSQDLIIVTSRGIELYKISILRIQCKLSRVINQAGFTFWYEPSHRMILMASFQKPTASYTSSQFNDRLPSEILLMDGYFFKYEKSTLPLLELPPPDKAPRFELGPGVVSDNVSLHSLYGKLCCLVHYTDNNSDFITVYHLTKYSVQRAHCLALNCLAGMLKFSVFDNLLLCHSQQRRNTFVFDLHSAGRRGSETREIIDPVCAPSAIHCAEMIVGMEYTPVVESIPDLVKRPVAVKGDRASGAPASSSASNYTASPTKQMNTLKLIDEQNDEQLQSNQQSDKQSSAMPDSDDDDEDQDGEGGEGEDNDGGSVGSEDAAVHLENETDDTSGSLSGEETDEEERSEWNTIGDSKHQISLLTQGRDSLCNTLGGVVGVDIKRLCTLTFQGTLSSIDTRHLTNSNNINSVNPAAAKPNKTINVRSVGSKTGTNSSATTASKLKVLSDPALLSEVYNASSFEFLYPNLAFDKVLKIMFKLVVNYSADVSAAAGGLSNNDGHELKDYMLFLTRRGQQYLQFSKHQMLLSYSNVASSAERALDYTFISEAGRSAKQMLLCMLRTSIEQKIGLRGLEELVGTIMQSYANEHRRQTRTDINDTDSSQDGGGSNASVNYSITSGSTSSSASGNYVISSKESAFGILRRKTMSDGLFGAKQAFQRKASIVGAITGGSAANETDSNACFYLEAEPLEPSSSLSSSNYLPEISIAGTRAKSFLRHLQLQPATLMSSSPVPLTTRRDVSGSLIVTQNEIFSYIWLPLLLRCGANDYGYLIWAMQTYIATLRELDLPLLPASSLLLMNVMFHRGKFLETARLMQLNFFPDSAEVAMSCLELRDILEDMHSAQLAALVNKAEFIASSSCASKAQLLLIKSAISLMQQAAIDMLWRLEEKITIVRWHLTHGFVTEAITMCTKKLGVWRVGLSPGCISGIEFFNAAVKAAAGIGNDHDHKDLAMMEKLIRENEALEQSERNDEESGAGSSRTDSTNSNEPVQHKYTCRDVLVAAQTTRQQAKRVQLLLGVHVFIREWDNSVLSVSTNLVKSKLAVQTQFPEHLFDQSTAKRLKEMFGFV